MSNAITLYFLRHIINIVHCFCDKLLILYPHPMPTLSAYRLVLCDTHDTSIITVDTYVTYLYRQGRDIPRYIVEQIITVRRRNFTQVSLVSPTPYSSFQYSNVQNFKVQSLKFKVQTSHDYVILLHYSVANDDVMFTLLNCRYILNFSFLVFY